jgi:glycosyltransferase involved in cell wall biosynthesis
VQTLKVLQVVSSSATSGAEKHAIAVARRLASQGHQVDFVSPPVPWIDQELQGTGVKIHQLDLKGNWGGRALRYLAKLCRTQKFDLVHAHLSRAAYLSLVATSFTNTPLVCSVHVKTHYLVYRLAARGNNRVIAVSNYIQGLLEGSRVPANHIDVVHNGTDFHDFRYTADNDVKTEFQIPHNRRLIGLVGRVAEEKGHAIAVNAMPSVLQAHPDAHLLLVGRAEGEFADYLQKEVIKKDLGNRITFTGNRPDVARMLDAMEFSILPSSAEACPLAVLESMARARPVVGARIGGVDELVIHRETGLLAEQTPEDFSAGMNFLLENEDDRHRMGNNALRLIQDRFTFDQMMERIEAVYARAIGA